MLSLCRQTDGQTDGRTDNGKTICPSRSFDTRGIKMHFELSPLIVRIALWIVNTYSKFQVNIISNNKMSTKSTSKKGHNSERKSILNYLPLSSTLSLPPLSPTTLSLPSFPHSLSSLSLSPLTLPSYSLSPLTHSLSPPSLSPTLSPTLSLSPYPTLSPTSERKSILNYLPPHSLSLLSLQPRSLPSPLSPTLSLPPPLSLLTLSLRSHSPLSLSLPSHALSLPPSLSPTLSPTLSLSNSLPLPNSLSPSPTLPPPISASHSLPPLFLSPLSL